MICIFLIAETKENLVIRSCISKDMNSQCGKFKYKGVPVRGCMLTCQHDLCNGGDQTRGLALGQILALVVLIGIHDNKIYRIYY